MVKARASKDDLSNRTMLSDTTVVEKDNQSQETNLVPTIKRHAILHN